MDWGKLADALGLNFWAKVIAIIPISYMSGIVFLNAYYATFWNFTDFNISSVSCNAVTVWLASMASISYLLSLIIDSFEKRLSRMKLKWKIGIFVIWICLVAALLLGAHALGETLLGHGFKLSSVGAEVLIIILIYLWAGLTLLLPITWIKERRKAKSSAELIPNPSKEKAPIPWPYYPWYGLCLLIVLVAMFWAFDITYGLFPARWGGGMPESVRLWVPRNTGPIFEGWCRTRSDNYGGSESKPEFVSYSSFKFVHDGGDYVVVEMTECNRVVRVPKEFIKAIEWSNPTWKDSPQAVKSRSQDQDSQTKVPLTSAGAKNK